jgi:HD-GYP domain-containing protein (c-di-GMP phosphodiesterase class II)
MSTETQGLLGKISALRQRLDQARGQAQNSAGEAVQHLTEDESGGLARLWELEKQAALGAEHRRQIDAAVKPAAESLRSLPSQLTARARRVLEKGRELLKALKEFKSEPLVHEPGGILTALYRDATALAEGALRLVAGLPDSPSGQLQQCEGIEAMLTATAHRLASLNHAVRQVREEQGRIDRLVGFFDSLETGAEFDHNSLTGLAGTLLFEASECLPLRLIHPPAPAAEHQWVARLVAGHSLTVAQVMARLVKHEPELRARSVEAVLAALLHDTGMTRLPPALLARTEPLRDEDRRTIESHTRVGAQVMARLFPGYTWLVEAAMHHHERLDGSGYPDGLRESQQSPLTRLLAVCDVYAAACQSRPYRAARDTRTALTDTLLLAEQGKFDRHFAERLLQLSFYPLGSVVELADGALAGVVATPVNPGDLHAPSRPVVAVLTDGEGRFLASPRYLDLAQSDSHSIVRSLTPAERRRMLGVRYPEWAV